MKKASTKAVEENNDMRAEYDFTRGVRGKHYRVMQAGYTITIRNKDGTTVVKEVKPKEGAVVLELDVREHFPDSGSVNAALRSLIRRTPTKRTMTARKAQRGDTRRWVASGNRSQLKKKV